jgi:hypothetical protein
MNSKEGFTGSGGDNPEKPGSGEFKDEKEKKKSKEGGQDQEGIPANEPKSPQEKPEQKAQEEPDNPENKEEWWTIPKDRESAVEAGMEDEELTPEELELGDLSEEERRDLIKEIRREAKQSREGEAEVSKEDAEVHEALGAYDSKIIDDGEDPGTALRDVLLSYGIDLGEAGEEKPETEELKAGEAETPPRQPAAGNILESETPIPVRQIEAGTADAAAPFRPIPTASAGTERPIVLTRDRLKYIDLSDDFLYSHIHPRSFDYVLGKRRGKIKSERKLKPIQKRLERQVNELGKMLETQEFTIRKLVAEKTKAGQMAAGAVQKVDKEPIITLRMERERSVAPEAQRLHSSQKAQEAIGHLVITEEAKSEKPKEPDLKIRPKITRKPEFVEPMASKNMDTVNQAELLKMSEKVFVNGSSLRQIYETHLIGERGLRRLLAEHQKGGDISKSIRHEIVEREIDFERDPIMRDMGTKGGSGGGAPSDNSTVLKQMIKEAEDTFASQDEEVAFYKAKAEYEQKERLQSQKQRRMLDMGIGAGIAVLIALIILLYLSKH